MQIHRFVNQMYSILNFMAFAIKLVGVTICFKKNATEFIPLKINV